MEWNHEITAGSQRDARPVDTLLAVPGLSLVYAVSGWAWPGSVGDTNPTCCGEGETATGLGTPGLSKATFDLAGGPFRCPKAQ